MPEESRVLLHHPFRVLAGGSPGASSSSSSERPDPFHVDDEIPVSSSPSRPTILSQCACQGRFSTTMMRSSLGMCSNRPMACRLTATVTRHFRMDAQQMIEDAAAHDDVADQALRDE